MREIIYTFLLLFIISSVQSSIINIPYCSSDAQVREIIIPVGPIEEWCLKKKIDRNTKSEIAKSIELPAKK